MCYAWYTHVRGTNVGDWHNSSNITTHQNTSDWYLSTHAPDWPRTSFPVTPSYFIHAWLQTHALYFSRPFAHKHAQTHTHAPATEFAHSKSAWINKRWSCASQPNLWGGDSLPHRQGSAGASARDTAGFQETNLFVYCLGVLSAVTVHCSQPILGMFF